MWNGCSASGTLYTWGEAHWGQLGLPKEFSDLHQSLPAKCPVLQDGSEERIVKISCGAYMRVVVYNANQRDCSRA